MHYLISQLLISVQLMQKHRVGDKARKEVDSLMEKWQGKILFEDLPEFKMLYQWIEETLRSSPVVPIMNRECTENYRIPGPDKKISNEERQTLCQSMGCR